MLPGKSKMQMSSKVALRLHLSLQSHAQPESMTLVSLGLRSNDAANWCKNRKKHLDPFSYCRARFITPKKSRHDTKVAPDCSTFCL